MTTEEKPAENTAPPEPATPEQATPEPAAAGAAAAESAAPGAVAAEAKATEPAAKTAGPAAKKEPWIWGLGRRKSAVARVRMRPGKGEFQINKREINRYLMSDRDRRAVLAPLKATQMEKNVDIFVNVNGGGTTGQAEAILLGVARALKKANAEFEAVLRSNNFLTRDSREVERKKYGRRGARRRFQFSKR